jgi:TorA maturation chaperone TorD
MKKEMSTGSASPEQNRLVKYKLFSAAFSYPDDTFFSTFPELRKDRNGLAKEYDRLFRANEIWLYSTEYMAENEFQKSNYLADIMGFYKAFGVEPTINRPDALSSELEFMYFLIHKTMRALKAKDDPDCQEKATVCQDAQKKFFSEHIQTPATKIAEAVKTKTNHGFYAEISKEMLDFLGKEHNFLEEMK